MPQTNNPILKATLLAAAMMTIMAGATIAPGLPGMLEQFKSIPGADLLVRLVITTTALAVAVSAPFTGLIADRFGRKPLLVFGLILYVIAGTSGAYLESLPLILVGRALLGVAVAAIMTANNALIADYFAGPARSAFIGLSSAFTAFGGVLLLPVGGFLADLGWHMPFLVYFSALLILPTAITVLFEPARAQQPGLARPGLTQPGSSQPGSSQPGSAQPISTAESTNKNPSFPLIYGLAFCHMIVFYIGPTQMPFLLETVGRLAPSQVGFALGLFTLSSAIVSLLYARIRAQFGFQAIAAIGFALLGLGWMVSGLASGLPWILIGFVIAGMGGGLLMPNWMNWLAVLSSPAMRGRLIGGLTTALYLGQFFSPALVQVFVPSVGLNAVVTGFGTVAVLVGAALGAGSRFRRIQTAEA
jgi:MFS family permease